MQKYKLKRNDGSTIYIHSGAGTELIFSPNGEVYLETDASFSQLDSNLITQDRWEKALLATHPPKLFGYVDFTREDGVWIHARASEPQLIKGTELMPGTNTAAITHELIAQAKAALAGNDEVRVSVDDNF
jgi:hypothetical protein